MLFKPEHIFLMLEGRKIATRRFWKRPHAKVGGIYLAKTQMISKKYFAKIRVKKLYRERLTHMDNQAAQDEGYPHLSAFLKVLARISKQEITQDFLRKEPWVIYFEVVEVPLIWQIRYVLYVVKRKINCLLNKLGEMTCNLLQKELFCTEK